MAYMDGHQPAARLLTLHPEEVDPFINLATLQDYLSLGDANRVIKVARLDQVSICHRQLAASDQPSTLRPQDGHFAWLAGDVVQVFSCPKMKATLRVDKQCYQDTFQSMSWTDPRRTCSSTSTLLKGVEDELLLSVVSVNSLDLTKGL